MNKCTRDCWALPVFVLVSPLSSALSRGYRNKEREEACFLLSFSSGMCVIISPFLQTAAAAIRAGCHCGSQGAIFSASSRRRVRGRVVSGTCCELVRRRWVWELEKGNVEWDSVKAARDVTPSTKLLRVYSMVSNLPPRTLQIAPEICLFGRAGPLARGHSAEEGSHVITSVLMKGCRVTRGN